MKRQPKVPTPSLTRLPLYYRYLLEAREQRLGVVSSEMLGEAAGVPAAQVRKDLGYLGEFGRPGIGYDVAEMLAKLSDQLGLSSERDVIVVGAGRLGSAISVYPGFARYNFKVVGVFDSDPTKIGKTAGGLVVTDYLRLPDFLRERGVEIAMLTVPASAAQQVADDLVRAGISAIMNFAPVKLQVPPHVVVSNEDLAARLATLSLRKMYGRELSEKA